MNIISNILITTFVLLIYASNAFAIENKTDNLREYDIEIIIFEDAHSSYIDSELWHESKPVNVNSTEHNEAVSTINETIITNIEPEILTQQYKSLRRSSQFNVLFRGAWRQAGLPESDAFEVDLKDLNNTHANKTGNTVTGKLKIVLARYLHFYSQLEYQRENDSDNVNNKQSNDELSSKTNTHNRSNLEQQNTILTTETHKYPIRSHRRMRSKELHYIDHPLLGILIQINPVEVKPVNTEQSEQVNASQFLNGDLAHR